MASIKNKIEKIKRFEFYFGNPFCGIRKVDIVFGNDYTVKSNALNKKTPPKQIEVINDLKDIDFDEWKEKYIISNPNTDKAWTINVTFLDEVITFSGIDCYPNDWDKILNFIGNFGDFDFEEMRTSKRTLYIVGDSTLSKFNDTSYYYPRYGYGTMLFNYLNMDKLDIVNLALSGRSSKSFLLEENYKILKESIKEGDFLIIGFGHNNEKADDVARFTSANLPLEDESSFMYSLNEYYIKLAKSVGATPILCTPIVRLSLNKDYIGTAIHETVHGDYRKNILELGKLVNVTTIDLTTPTKYLFNNLSVEEACLHHAITAGKVVNDKGEPNFKSVDKAHLNIYGAKYVAYLVVSGIKNSNNPLKRYLIDNIVEPSINDLVVNPLYKVIKYQTPDLKVYKQPNHLSVNVDGWYGTVFGDVGCNPLEEKNGYKVIKIDNRIIVGQNGDTLYGRFNASSDGFACGFKQVSVKDNFVIKTKAKVVEVTPSKQTSFGLMLRDDIYVNQTTNRESTMNNYVSAGFLTLNVSMNILFARECTTELNMANNIIEGFYDVNDEALLTITRLGQSITTTVIYKGKEYSKTYLDFDLTSIDREYMYICLYSTCGTVVEYSDIEYIYTGKAIEA